MRLYEGAKPLSNELNFLVLSVIRNSTDGWSRPARPSQTVKSNVTSISYTARISHVTDIFVFLVQYEENDSETGKIVQSYAN